MDHPNLLISNDIPQPGGDIPALGWFVLPDSSGGQLLEHGSDEATLCEMSIDRAPSSQDTPRPISPSIRSRHAQGLSSHAPRLEHEYETFAISMAYLRRCEKRMYMSEIADIEELNLRAILRDCRQAITSMVTWADDAAIELAAEGITLREEDPLINVFPRLRPRSHHPTTLRFRRRDQIDECMSDYCDTNSTRMSLMCNNSTRPPKYGPKAVFDYRCTLCGHKSKPRNNTAIEVHCNDVKSRESITLAVLAAVTVATMLLMWACMHCRKVRDRRAKFAAMKADSMSGHSGQTDWSTLRGAIFDGTNEEGLVREANRGWYEMWSMKSRPEMNATTRDVERLPDNHDNQPSCETVSKSWRDTWSFGNRSFGNPKQSVNHTGSESNPQSLVPRSAPTSLRFCKGHSHARDRIPIMPHARSSSINLPAPPVGSLKPRAPLRDFSSNSAESLSMQLPTAARVARGELADTRLSQWSEVSEPISSVKKAGSGSCR